MKTREWLFGFFSSLVAVPAFATQSKGTRELPKIQKLRELHSMVRIKERDQVILVKTDGDNLFYTVMSDRNEILLENVGLDEIRAVNPELYERLKVSVADAKVDASNSYDGKPRELF